MTLQNTKSETLNTETREARVIRKHFDFLWHAERYQNRLYNQFDSVTLIQFPRFGDAGVYAWSVASNLNKSDSDAV